MRPVDSPAPPRPAPRALVSGWGGGGRVPVWLAQPVGVDALAGMLDLVRDRGAISRGLGRSYGDAAQLSGGWVLQTSRLQHLELDPINGTVTAQAGVTIGLLLRALVPNGWILPVVPGTQHVTVGGAIASDIHGKNHRGAGTFGNHVQALGLLTSGGELLELEPRSSGGLFEATLGGMGLTGLVVWARIALRRVDSALLSVDSERVNGLDEALRALMAPGGPYRVAWLDLLSSQLVRGVVTRAEHSSGPPDSSARDGSPGVAPRLEIPRWWPSALLRASTVRAANELRFRRSPRREHGREEGFGQHMFPLDAVAKWPRLYGQAGFVQYQLAVPLGRERVLEDVLVTLRSAGVPCFLAVLKDLGAANRAPMSFPIEGWTLALDLPRAAAALEPALARCDRIVAEAGGRVYLTKDARLCPELLPAMYPRLSEWRSARDRADPEHLWQSDLAIRTGLCERVLR